MLILSLPFVLHSLVTAINFNWTPNAIECQEVYDRCLRTAGQNCRDGLLLCNAKAYEGSDFEASAKGDLKTLERAEPVETAGHEVQETSEPKAQDSGQ